MQWDATGIKECHPSVHKLVVTHIKNCWVEIDYCASYRQEVNKRCTHSATDAGDLYQK